MNGSISFLNRNPDVSYCDIAVEDNDIARGDNLISMINIMLGTDRRASIEELTTKMLNQTYPFDQRGWWADTFRQSPIGSKLWLNVNSKATTETLRDQQAYIEEALNPLIDRGIAKEVNVFAYWKSPEVMECTITIVRPDDSIIQQKYVYLWEGVANALY